MSVRLPPHLFLTTYWEIIKLPPKHEATRQLLWLWYDVPEQTRNRYAMLLGVQLIVFSWCRTLLQAPWYGSNREALEENQPGIAQTPAPPDYQGRDGANGHRRVGWEYHRTRQISWFWSRDPRSTA